MGKRGVLSKLVFFIIGLSLICINVSHAQTSGSTIAITPQGPTLQQAGPTITLTTPPAISVPDPNAPAATPVPGAVAAPGSASVPPATTAPVNVDGLLNGGSQPGKYAEYQSICRTHEFDEKLYQPDELVNKIKAELRTEGLGLLKNTDRKFKWMWKF